MMMQLSAGARKTDVLAIYNMSVIMTKSAVNCATEMFRNLYDSTARMNDRQTLSELNELGQRTLIISQLCFSFE